MRAANVYVNKVLAGTLIEADDRSYTFRYDAAYYADTSKPPVSLTLPKTKPEYHSKELFPFFFNLLSEGYNKQVQLRYYKIDEKDYFSLLIATAQYDTIGTVTVKETTHDTQTN